MSYSQSSHFFSNLIEEHEKNYPHYHTKNYRYAFNGMEQDKEVSGSGNSYTTQFRQYDPRLGRWKSLDPLATKFPWQSPFVGMDNNPIALTDVLGLAASGGPKKSISGEAAEAQGLQKSEDGKWATVTDHNDISAIYKYNEETGQWEFYSILSKPIVADGGKVPNKESNLPLTEESSLLEDLADFAKWIEKGFNSLKGSSDINFGFDLSKGAPSVGDPEDVHHANPNNVVDIPYETIELLETIIGVFEAAPDYKKTKSEDSYVKQEVDRMKKTGSYEGMEKVHMETIARVRYHHSHIKKIKQQNADYFKKWAENYAKNMMKMKLDPINFLKAFKFQDPMALLPDALGLALPAEKEVKGVEQKVYWELKDGSIISAPAGPNRTPGDTIKAY